MNYTRGQLETLLRSIFEGETTPSRLPQGLFSMILGILTDGVARGFGVGDLDEEAENLLDHFDNNIGVFSAAKTHQQVVDMRSKVFDSEGKKRPFSDFRKDANEVFDEYNKNWLRTEYRTAVNNSFAARQWLEFQKQKDLFPLLRYQTALDERVREDHEDLDGIVRHIDDKFWLLWFPPNGWNCRCDVTSHAIGELEVTPEYAIKDLIPPSDLFSINPALDKVIFNPEHPYISKVDERYHALRDRNFDLPVRPKPIKTKTEKAEEVKEKMRVNLLNAEIETLRKKGVSNYMNPIAKQVKKDIEALGSDIEIQVASDFRLILKPETAKEAFSIEEAIDNELEFIKTLSKAEKEAVSIWTYDYTSINGHLRGRAGFESLAESKAFLKIVSDLGKVIEKAPKVNSETFRLMSFSTKESLDSFLESIKKGGIFTDKGFMSSSFDEIERFGGEFSVTMKIKGKSGMFIRELGSGGNTISDKEVLFNSNSKFSIDKVYVSEFDNGFKEKYVIEMTEL